MIPTKLPPEVHAAIRAWSEDMTNVEPFREATYAAENLGAYLEQAGFEIVAIKARPSRKGDRA